MIKALKRLWAWLNEPAWTWPAKQTIWCWCPGCGGDLCTKPGVDASDWELTQVIYVCPCGTITKWDFGLPVPILLTVNEHEKRG